MSSERFAKKLYIHIILLIKSPSIFPIYRGDSPIYYTCKFGGVLKIFPILNIVFSFVTWYFWKRNIHEFHLIFNQNISLSLVMNKVKTLVSLFPKLCIYVIPTSLVNWPFFPTSEHPWLVSNDFAYHHEITFKSDTFNNEFLTFRVYFSMF